MAKARLPEPASESNIEVPLLEEEVKVGKLKVAAGGSGANLKGSASGGNGLNDRTSLGAGTLQGSAFRPRNYCPVRAVVPDIQAQLP